jgi:hypothetical protein
MVPDSNCTYRKKTPVVIVFVAIGPSVSGRVAGEPLRKPLDLTNMWQRSWILEESAVHHGANQVVLLGNNSPDGETHI